MIHLLEGQPTRSDKQATACGRRVHVNYVSLWVRTAATGVLVTCPECLDAVRWSTQ